jgi:universal stress protein E
MGVLKKITAVVNTAASEHPAIDRARLYAHAFNTEIEFYSGYPALSLVGRQFIENTPLDAAREQLIEEHNKILKSHAEPLRADGLTVTTYSGCASPVYENLLIRLKKTSCDLLIHGVDFGNGLDRCLLGMGHWEIARLAHCPLPLTANRPYADRPTILAAVDPLHEHDKPATLDTKLLWLVQLLAKKFDGKLKAFHSVQVRTTYAQDPEIDAIPATVATPELLEEIMSFHRDQLEKLTSQFDLDDADVMLRQGAPDSELLKICDQGNIDMVLMGVISRSLIERAVIGDTAERVLNRLPCDVLLIKPDAFAGSDRQIVRLPANV